MFLAHAKTSAVSNIALIEVLPTSPSGDPEFIGYALPLGSNPCASDYIACVTVPTAPYSSRSCFWRMPRLVQSLTLH